MLNKSNKWRLHIWIACLAILMNALAPSISHALAASRGDVVRWDICRSPADANAKPVSPALLAAIAEARLAQDLEQLGAMRGDCAYCLPHAGNDLLLPPSWDGMGLAVMHAARPFLFYHAPQPLAQLSAAQPRGPPAFA